MSHQITDHTVLNNIYNMTLENKLTQEEIDKLGINNVDDNQYNNKNLSNYITKRACCRGISKGKGYRDVEITLPDLKKYKESLKYPEENSNTLKNHSKNPIKNYLKKPKDSSLK